VVEDAATTTAIVVGVVVIACDDRDFQIILTIVATTAVLIHDVKNRVGHRSGPQNEIQYNKPLPPSFYYCRHLFVVVVVVGGGGGGGAVDNRYDIVFWYRARATTSRFFSRIVARRFLGDETSSEPCWP